ncbi:MAG: hypothetical protein ABFE13_11350 [Phycisphaerales bacterium]
MNTRTSALVGALAMAVIFCLLGATTFTKNRASVDELKWGYGTWNKVTSTGGVAAKYKMSPINVLGRGVNGDGTDESDSMQAIVDEVVAFGSGAIELPYTVKGYKFNITVTGDNVTIFGHGCTSATTDSATMIRAADETKPIIDLDGSGIATYGVQGFYAHDLTLVGGSTADYGINVKSAHKARFDRVSVMDFEKHALRIGAATVRTSHVYFNNCNFTNSDSNTVEVYYGAPYTSAIRFSGCTITDGNSAGSRALMVVGVGIYMEDVWMDVHNGQGILLKNSGAHLAKITGINVSIDSGSASDVLVEFGDNSEPYKRLGGGITIDGLIKFGNDSTTYWSGDYMLGEASTLYNPMLEGSLYFADTHDSVATRYNTASQKDARITNAGGNLTFYNTSGGDFIFAPTGSGKTKFDGTGGAYAFNKTIGVDSLVELSSGGGLRIDNVHLKDGIARAISARVDTVSMKTALHGVVIDPVLPINAVAWTTSDTLSATDNVVFFSGQTGNVFCTLPTYATVPVGKTYLIINCDSAATDTVFVEANGSEFLNGSAGRYPVALRGFDPGWPPVYARAKVMYVNSTVGWARVD